MSSTNHPKFLPMASIPELFAQAACPVMVVGRPSPERLALRELASRWHDPHCECKTKAVGGNVVEVKVCLRCANVRRQIAERL